MLVDEEEGSILMLGTLKDVLEYSQELKQASTRRVVKVDVRDLGGAFLMPGFVDPHVHLMVGGLMLDQVDLSGAHSLDQAARMVGNARLQLQPGQGPAAVDGGDDAGDGWVLCGGWDEAKWGGQLPDSAWVDEVRVLTHIAFPPP